MFANLHSIPSMSNDQYRQRPGISNTDLSNLADQLLGRLRDPSPKAFKFGQLFHSAILEPDDFACTTASCEEDQQQRDQAHQLARVIKRHRYSRHVLYRGVPELSHFATHEETGLLVKVRPDLLIDSPKRTRRTVVDFKTTSASNEQRFLDTILEYGYDRQAALYCDVVGAQRFVIIGVQKRSPHRAWVAYIQQGSQLMELGRKKYRRLLRHLAEQQKGQPVTFDQPFEGYDVQIKTDDGGWVNARRVGLHEFDAGPLGFISAAMWRRPLTASSTVGSSTVTLQAA